MEPCDSIGAEDFRGERLLKFCFVVFQFGCLMHSAVSARPNEAWYPGSLCLTVGCSGPQEGIAVLWKVFLSFIGLSSVQIL